MFHEALHDLGKELSQEDDQMQNKKEAVAGGFGGLVFTHRNQSHEGQGFLVHPGVVFLTKLCHFAPGGRGKMAELRKETNSLP